MLGNVNKKQSLFDKIDDYFAKEKPSTLQMAYIGVAALIGYMVYTYVFPVTDEALKMTKSKIQSTTQKLNQEKNYLSTHNAQTLNRARVALKQKKIEYDNTIYKISYVENKLTELSYLLFDDKSWAAFVDNISELAKKYNIDIQEIGNKFYDPTYKKITHVAEVDVVSSGKTKDMLKFLNAIEESQLVIDINDIKLQKPDKMVEGSFKIAVWGMKY